MPSQESRYWERKDEEAAESEASSGSGSGEDEDDGDDEQGNGTGSRVGSAPVWPQSYRQSMDMYSSLQSPSLSIFSPGIHHRLSSSHLSSSYQRTPQDEHTTGSQPLKIPFLPAKGGHYLPVTDQVRKSEEEVRKAEVLEAELVADSRKSSFVQGLFNANKDILEAWQHTLPYMMSVMARSFFRDSRKGINVLAGVGILTTPYALKEGGWLILLYLLIFSIICFYTGILLRRCLECESGVVTYPDIGQAAFGTTGRIIISIILYIELYACAVEFLILEGDNLANLFPGMQQHLEGYSISPNTFFSFITALFVLPTVWLRDLRYLSYVSAGGCIASIVVGTSVFWVGEVDGVGFHENGPLINWAGVPVSIGLFGFCYSGHAVFPNIYSSLRTKSDYTRVLAVSFILCTSLYAVLAIAGFTMFGEDTASQITLNLPNQFFASKLATWTTVVNPFTKFALSMTPVALSLEELLPYSPESFEHRSSSILIRTALVASTISVAVLVPFFGFVMAFIGAFLSMTVSVILPCACYLKIYGKKVSRLEVIVNYIVLLVGFICLVAGTYSSVSGIITSYSKPGLLVY